MEHCIGTFKATEADGTPHTISIIQGYHEVPGEAGHLKVSPDRLVELRTEDGRFVQPRAEGGYEIIDGTERIPLLSDDPNAPDAPGEEL